jgi:tripartite-type tricarboxylate transporter receptor subunit TctC
MFTPVILVPAVLNGLMTGAVYALIALGLTLIYGVLHIINFAHGALLTAAMFAAFFAHKLLGFDPYMAAIGLTHVPYKGFGAAVGDAISCNVDLIFGAISTGIPHVRAGKLKPIAVTQPKRHPGLPDTPTFGEAGHPGVVMEAYMGLLAPAGTPRPIVDKLYIEVAAILLEKDTAERLTGAGLDLVRSTPEQYAARIRADLAKYAKLSKALAAKAE